MVLFETVGERTEDVESENTSSCANICGKMTGEPLQRLGIALILAGGLLEIAIQVGDHLSATTYLIFAGLGAALLGTIISLGRETSPKRDTE